MARKAPDPARSGGRRLPPAATQKTLNALNEAGHIAGSCPRQASLARLRDDDGIPPDPAIAFLRWLYWQTAKYNHDDWRESRWWPLIVRDGGRR